MRVVTGVDATRVYNAGPLDRIPLGEGRTVNVGGEEIAIFRPRLGRVCAVQAMCPHRGGPLADGIVGGSRVVCPLHSYAFELSTGESLRGDCPALRTYRVTVDEQGLVLVHLDAAGDDTDAVTDAPASGAYGARA
ncbi:MAG: Rieske 2Fe-2S domain-containing protein [Longimicrobiales bacterium]